MSGNTIPRRVLLVKHIRLKGSGGSHGWVQFNVMVGIFVGMMLSSISLSSWAADGETSEHFFKTLDIPLEGETFPKQLSFPLFQQNKIQYFSAGLGKEERKLSYPPYPLKLIFVKGERAFLANVAVEVLHPDGTTLLSIPSEEIQGPWLFLNLPAGKYLVQATDTNGKTIEKNVSLAPDTPTTTVHFRWP